MGYKAVYPEEAINGHRSFIARRRATRPSEEYRSPTDAEWEEFLGHFQRHRLQEIRDNLGIPAYRDIAAATITTPGTPMPADNLTAALFYPVASTSAIEAIMSCLTG